MDLKTLVIPQNIRSIPQPKDGELTLDDLAEAYMIGQLQGKAVMEYLVTGSIVHRDATRNQKNLLALSKWATDDADELFADSTWQKYYTKGFREIVVKVLKRLGEGDLSMITTGAIHKYDLQLTFDVGGNE